MFLTAPIGTWLTPKRRRFRTKRASSNEVVSLNSLPAELVFLVTSLLPPRSHYALGLTSRKLHTILAPTLAQHASKHPKLRELNLKDAAGDGPQQSLAWQVLEIYENEDPKGEVTQYIETMIILVRQPRFRAEGFEGLAGDASLTARAPKYYAMMKNNPLLCGSTEPGYKNEIPPNLQPRLDMFTDYGPCSLRERLLYGEEGPIIARLLTMAPNVRRLLISMGNTDLVLSRFLARVAAAYVYFTERSASTPSISLPSWLPFQSYVHFAKKPAPTPYTLFPSWLPFQYLTKVQLYAFARQSEMELVYFALIPTVVYLRGEKIDEAPAPKMQTWLRGNVDTRRRPSNVKHLILDLCQASTMNLPLLIGNIAGLAIFFADFHRADKLDVSTVTALSEFQAETLGALWLTTSLVHRVGLSRDTLPDKTWKAPDRDLFGEHLRPFSRLHTLQCKLSTIFDVYSQNVRLLSESLEVLVVLHVPASAVPQILAWFEKLPKLRAFSATAYHEDGQVIHIDALRKEVERCGLVWLKKEARRGVMKLVRHGDLS